MDRIADMYCRALVVLMGLALALMVVLVFGNVVLRYGFNSSIMVSDELGRWLFVWITFMGAVVAVRERSHLGTDALISRLGPTGKKVCFVLAHVTMIYVCYLVFKGSLEQTRINMTVLAPTTQWPLAVVHSAGVAFSVSAALLLTLDLWRLLRGKVRDEQLVLVRESEDLPAVKHPHGDKN